MSRTAWTWCRRVGPALTLAVLVWRLGTGPFLDGVRAGAQRGVTTAVLYGIMVFVACLPGAAVLMVAWFRRTRPAGRNQPRLLEGAAHA
jgi:hypothetical protein